MTALLLRDLRLSIRAGGGALVGVLFFLTVVAVIPFGVGPDLKLLSLDQPEKQLKRAFEYFKMHLEQRLGVCGGPESSGRS